MTVLLVLLVVAALFAAVHMAAPLLILDEEWEAPDGELADELERLLSARGEDTEDSWAR